LFVETRISPRFVFQLSPKITALAAKPLLYFNINLIYLVFVRKHDKISDGDESFGYSVAKRRREN
jgi:hypothetical protein